MVRALLLALGILIGVSTFAKADIDYTRLSRYATSVFLDDPGVIRLSRAINTLVSNKLRYGPNDCTVLVHTDDYMYEGLLNRMLGLPSDACALNRLKELATSEPDIIPPILSSDWHFLSAQGEWQLAGVYEFKLDELDPKYVQEDLAHLLRIRITEEDVLELWDGDEWRATASPDLEKREYKKDKYIGRRPKESDPTYREWWYSPIYRVNFMERVWPNRKPGTYLPNAYEDSDGGEFKEIPVAFCAPLRSKNWTWTRHGTIFPAVGDVPLIKPGPLPDCMYLPRFTLYTPEGRHYLLNLRYERVRD